MTQREVFFDTFLASILACLTHKHTLVLIQELSFGLLLFCATETIWMDPWFS